MNETRYLRAIPAPGELVLSRDASGGLRHFLDGRPVELGTMLRHVGGVSGSRARATVVRYESRLDGEGCAAVLVYPDGTERIARAEDRFEWPTVRKPTTATRRWDSVSSGDGIELVSRLDGSTGYRCKAGGVHDSATAAALCTLRGGDHA